MSYHKVNMALGRRDGDWMRLVEDRIYGEYGDVVSVVRKAKSLNKFGSAVVPTTAQTVAQLQGATLHMDYPTTNLVDALVSSDAGDTFSVKTEGLMVNASGILTFVAQTVTLNGTTPVSLPTPVRDITRMAIDGSGTFGTDPATLVAAGTIYAYQSTGGQSGGTPSTASKTSATIEAGKTQTRKCATSFADDTYWIVTSVAMAVAGSANQTNFIIGQMQVRDVPGGGPFNPLGREVVAPPDIYEPTKIALDPEFRIVPPNHDFRFIASTDAATAPVFAEVTGIMALKLNR